MNYRTLTPSMALLRAFESAARQQSYTRAAVELSLTQSAISRQIQTLEAQLGVALFRRHGRSVQLTAQGQQYFVEISAALGRIRSATLQALAQTQHHGGALRLACLPTFASRWLLPHLHEFYAAYPGITLHLHSRIGAIDFQREALDAAISVGHPDHADWRGLRTHRLHNEFLIAIAKPALAAEIQQIPDVAAHTLLTVSSNPQAWAEWFHHHHLEPRHMRLGPSFELTSHLIQAVQTGMGLGLVPHMLVQDELQCGQLQALGSAIASQRSYYLVYPKGNEHLAAVQAFSTWLLAACDQPKP